MGKLCKTLQKETRLSMMDVYFIVTVFSTCHSAAQITANKRSKEFKTQNIVSHSKIEFIFIFSYISVYETVCAGHSKDR